MDVIEIKPVEDCFDGSLINELLFSHKVIKEHIFALGKGGQIQYFPEFGRPFYKIRLDGLFDVKGIEGNSTMRVHLKSPIVFTIDSFLELLKSIG